MNGVMIAGLSALGVALIFSVAATVSLIGHIRGLTRARRAAADPIDWPATWAERVAANGGWPPMPSWASHRHNIHCPRCGRFASRRDIVAGARTFECRVHGLYVEVPSWIS